MIWCSLLDWSEKGIYFAALKKTAAHLYLLNVATGAVVQVTHPDDVVANGFSFSKDFSQVAYRAAAPNAGGEIYVASTVGSGAAEQITHVCDAMKPYTLARREVVRWKSGDGAEIEGVLYKPADFSPAKMSCRLRRTVDSNALYFAGAGYGTRVGYLSMLS